MGAQVLFADESAPLVSVIVVAWSHAPYLLDCLQSLEANIEAVPYEVIVVLNEPTSELEQSVADLVEGAVLVQTRVNSGFAGAVNLGAAQARGKYFVMLNDDAEVQPGWLEALVHLAELAPQIGAVGSMVLFADRSIQESGSVLWSDGSTANVGRGLAPDTARYAFARPVDYCSGCSLLIRRYVWEELGGLDVGYYPAYYEDVDFCLRLRELGWEVWVQPRSRVVHRLSSSTGGIYRSFLMERQRRRLVERWSDVLAAQMAPPMESGDPFGVDRAISRAMSMPMAALAMLDDDLRRMESREAIERLHAAAKTVLDDEFVRLTVLGPRDLVAWAEETMGGAVEVFDQPLGAHLAQAAVPYALVLVAASAVQCESMVRSARAAIGGTPIALDVETLHLDHSLTDAARSAEVRAAREADYLVCTSEDVAQRLERTLWLTTSIGGLLIYATSQVRVSSSSEGGISATGEPIKADATVAPDTTAATSPHHLALSPTSPLPGVALPSNPSELAPVELELLLRDLEVKGAYAQHLEGLVIQLLERAENSDQSVRHAETYAVELKAQIVDLDEEIRSKNNYITLMEREVSRLSDECAALRGELAVAESTIDRLSGEL